MSEELKPCPFCGEEAYYYSSFGARPQMMGLCETGHVVGCKNCQFQFKPEQGKKRAIDKWNKRTEKR